MTTLAAALVCGLLGALAVFQALLTFGAPLGRLAWSDDVRIRCQNPVEEIAVVRTAAWVVVGYVFIGIGANLASRNTSERAVMTPTVAVLCGLCVVVAAS